MVIVIVIVVVINTPLPLTATCKLQFYLKQFFLCLSEQTRVSFTALLYFIFILRFVLNFFCLFVLPSWVDIAVLHFDISLQP